MSNDNPSSRGDTGGGLAKGSDTQKFIATKSLPPARLLEQHWGEFLVWIKANRPNRTFAGGVYGRVAANGMDATQDMDYIPSETSFWIWYTLHKLTSGNDLVPPDQEANTDVLKQPTPSATTKSLEDIFFELRGMLLGRKSWEINPHNTDDAQVLGVDQELAKYRTAIDNYTTQRVIEELEKLEPPEHYLHFAKMANNAPCVICGFSPVDLKQYIQERVESLKGGIDE